MQKNTTSKILDEILQNHSNNNIADYLKLLNALNKLDFAVCILNAELKIIFSNPSFNQLIDHQKGSSFSDLDYIFDLKNIREHLKKSLKTDLQLQIKNSEEYFVTNYIFKPQIFELDSQSFHLIYQAYSIPVKFEERIFQKNILENINTGIAVHEIITDNNNKPTDFIYKYVNKTYEELTLLKAKDIIGKRGKEVIPILEDKWIEIYGEVALSGRPIHFIDHSEYMNKYWDIYAFPTSPMHLAVSLKDISESKKTEILAESFFEQPNVIHIVSKMDGTIISANKGWKTILGFQQHEVIKKKFFSFVHPDDLEKTNLEMSRLEKGITTFHFENRYIHKSGHTVQLNWSANVNLEEGLIYGTAIDNTEKHAIQKNVEESDEKFRKFINNATDGVAIVDKNAKISFVNNSFCEIINEEKDQIIGKYAWDLIFSMSNRKNKEESFRQEIKKQITQLLQQNKELLVSKNQKSVLQRKTGEIIDVSESFFAFSTAEGINLGVFIKDLSDIKKAEREMQSAYELLSATEKIAKSGSWTSNPKTGESSWSKGSYAIRGASTKIKGNTRNHEKYMHPEDVVPYRTQFEKNINSKQSEFRQFYRLVDEQGRIKHIEAHYNIQRNKKGEAVFITGIDKDVTDLIKAQDQLKSTLKALKDSDERFNIAMKASKDGLFDWNITTNEIYYSPGWKKMLGYEEHELPNEFSVWENLTDTDDVAESWKRLQAHINGESSRFEMEFKMRHKDGHFVNILSRANALFDENGKATRMIGTHVDISELKELQKVLEYQKNLTQQYLDVAGTILMALNTQQEVIMMNPKGCEILGYSKEEILGKNWFDHFTPIENKNEIKKVFNRAINGEIEIVEYYENPILTKKGERKIIAWHNSVIKDENGHIIRLFSSGNDITNEIENKKALELSERKFRELFEKSGDAVFILENDIIINCNKSSLELFEYNSYEDIVGKSPFDLSPKYQKNKTLSKTKALENINTAIIQSNLRFEWLHQTSTGKIVPCEVLLTYLGKNEVGKHTTHAVMRDITDRKQKEQEILLAKEKAEESQKKLQEAHNIAKLGSWELDIDKEMFTFTDSFYNIFHTTAKEMGGYQIPLEKYARLFVHPDDMHIVQEENQKAIETDNPHFSHYLEHRIKYLDGGIGYISVRFYVVKDEHGKTIKTYGVNQDITEKRNADKQIIQAKEKAEESDRLKSAFLANMSHEIRTPMNGIMGFAELLKEPQLEEGEIQQYVEVIERSGKRMLNIINDLIDISKIEAQQMDVHYQNTNINDQINYLKTFFLPEANRKKIRLISVTPLEKEKSVIYSDREKLYAILTNLIKNAIKHTEKGSIEFGYKDKSDQLEFFVKDTGEGIPQNRQENIFERFVQAEMAHNRKYEGAGLGLAISKAYVEMLGGKIWIEKSNNSGTEFRFTIPKEG